MKANDLPEKYKTCDWLWNYCSIGLTEEHIKKLNDVIDILESLTELTHAKYLKEIKDKLLEDTPEQKVWKTNTDDFVEKALSWLKNHYRDYMHNPTGKRLEAFFGGDMCNDFENYMKGE